MKRLFWIALYSVALSARGDEAAILDKDFRIMMEWFPGVYDNQEQVYFEEEQEVDESLRHERIHHVFEPVELPAFGQHVFYVQQHLNDDPAASYTWADPSVERIGLNLRWMQASCSHALH